MNKFEIFNNAKSLNQYNLERRDIVDRNGELISRNVKFFHAAIVPKNITNKDNFILKLKLNFPELSIEKIEKNITEGKYFYLKKRINQIEKEKLWKLGKKLLCLSHFNQEFILTLIYIVI